MFSLAPSPEPNTVVIHTYGTYEEMDHSLYYYSTFDLGLHLNSKSSDRKAEDNANANVQKRS